MVVSLNPAKFYGSSLPRPRYYTDVKFSDERVDPPLPVLDPLMSWAEEAHWSMGGLSFNRLRLQGKIEGNVKKLKKEREVTWNKKMENSTPESKKGTEKAGRKADDSPPPAPIGKKKRQRKVVDFEEKEFVDESEDEVVEVGGKRKRRRLVRKLGDDFELVGGEKGKNGGSPLKEAPIDRVALRTRSRNRSRRSMVLMDAEEEVDYDNDEVMKGKGDEKVVENGDVMQINVSPKKNGGKKKGSVSPSGSRSSPRLKKKSN